MSILKGKVLVLFIIGCILIIGGIIVQISFSSDNSKKNSMYSFSNSFLLDNGDMFAVFNEKGKQLTPFIYKLVNDNKEFINGATVVKNDKDQYAIITEQGKEIVKFGQYDSIKRVNSLYEATDTNNKIHIINSRGRIIDDSNNTEDFGLVEFWDGSIRAITILEKDKNYYFLNSNGEKILTIKKSNKDADFSLGDADNFNKYSLINYDKKGYLIDNEKEKVVLTMSQENNYCINSTNENNELVISNCGEMFEKIENYNYKFISKNKVVLETTSSECNNLYLEDNNLICDNYIISKKTKKKELKISNGNYTRNISYADNKNYAINDKKTVKIYTNGKLSNTIQCGEVYYETAGYNESGIHILHVEEGNNCPWDKNGYIYVDKSGKLINNEIYLKVHNFINNRAIVQKEKGQEYLIDDKGKIVSKKYESVSGEGDYYHGKLSNKESLFDKDGNEIFSSEKLLCNLWNIHKDDSKDFYAVFKNKNQFIIYDTIKKKDVLHLENGSNFNDYYIDLTNHYIYVKDEKKTKYYSYDNYKIFYEKKNT